MRWRGGPGRGAAAPPLQRLKAPQRGPGARLAPNNLLSRQPLGPSPPPATPSSPQRLPTPPCPGRTHREPGQGGRAQEQAQPLCLGLLKLSWAHLHESRTCRCLVPTGLKGPQEF